jgi:hypothetical protein
MGDVYACYRGHADAYDCSITLTRQETCYLQPTPAFRPRKIQTVVNSLHNSFLFDYQHINSKFWNVMPRSFKVLQGEIAADAVYQCPNCQSLSEVV